MARYNGPKARVNRRLGFSVYESAGALKAAGRREIPPGMHARARRPTGYGQALNQKQRIKHYYGLGERQLRRLFQNVVHVKGNAGTELMMLIERRLDNVIRRCGLTKTRPQARQGVVHGHFLVNGRKVTKPSFTLRPGDVITVRKTEKIQNLYKGVLANQSAEPMDWVSLDAEALAITVQGLPGTEDISLKVDFNTVVEFLSR